jgi:uncharacterized protein
VRIVVDTNVVVSGLLKPSGVSARVLELAQEGLRVTLLYDERIIAEYFEVLTRKDLDRRRIQQVVESLRAIGEPVVAKPISIQSPDPDDQMFIEVAVAGFADVIVTGNAKHFPTDCGVPVLSPAQLLRTMG